MNRSSIFVALTGIWAVVAAVLSVMTVQDSNADARLLVGLAGLIGALAAGSAAFFFAKSKLRPAGFMLVVSAITPSGFFYLPNLVAFIVGLAVLVRASTGKSRLGNQRH